MVLGLVRSPTLLVALTAIDGGRGKFDMLNIATSEVRAQKQHTPRRR